MNLVRSNILTWKISKILRLENKGAEWAWQSELAIACTACFCNIREVLKKKVDMSVDDQVELQYMI